MSVVGFGDPTILGVRRRGDTWNVAVRAPHADGVELCLIDGNDETRVSLNGPTKSVFHATVNGLDEGMEYGYRVHGPWRPHSGIRCDPTKLLLDPYALAVTGSFDGDPSALSTPHPGSSDSSRHVPHGVVTEPAEFATHRPRIPVEETAIYEAHVKDLTMRHPAVPSEMRGRFLGVSSDPIIEHLLSLGITTLELMPVAEAITEPFLLDAERTNHWGYAPINYFAPWSRYATSSRGGQIDEFRHMVDRLHEAGLEVVVDVVYNHTGEGGRGGPHLSFRGLDESGWYRLAGAGQHVNWSGTGNTLDVTAPHVLDLVLASLRWWVEGLGVDGFRFDLAVTLGRDPETFTQAATFFEELRRDPILGGIKLIAEPWDVGPDGYQVGNFPEEWLEWNDAFRDDLRIMWRDNGGHLPDLATRLAGSRDRFGWKRPTSAVNYLTSHDGFTLRDVVSYNHRHNEANGEENRDGHGDNHSWNSGVEGPTDDPEVTDLRIRRTRSMLLSLLCAQGTPMLLSGDELGNTQQGNNNAYAQDNEISWLDWEHTDQDLLDFTATLIGIRRDHGVLRRTEWLEPNGEVTWLDDEGQSLDDSGWENLSCGLQIRYRGDPDLLLVFNTGHDDLKMTLPTGEWRVLADADSTRDDKTVEGTVTRRGLTALVAEAVVPEDGGGAPPRDV